MEIEARYWTSDENRLIRAVLANDIVQTKRLMAELEDKRIIDDWGGTMRHYLFSILPLQIK